MKHPESDQLNQLSQSALTEIILTKDHIEDIDLENQLIYFYLYCKTKDSEYSVIYNVHNLGDITFYRDNDPLMYGEYTYSTAREVLSYSLEAVIDEYGESLPKENFSVCFENVSDIDDYVDSVLCNDWGVYETIYCPFRASRSDIWQLTPFLLLLI